MPSSMMVMIYETLENQGRLPRSDEACKSDPPRLRPPRMVPLQVFHLYTL